MKRGQFDGQLIFPLLRISRDESQSLQVQLRTRLLELIEADILTPHTKLPSTRKLSENLGISRNTATLTYQYLIGDGHLYTKNRSGIFIAPKQARTLKHDRKVIAGQNTATESVAAGKLSTDFSVTAKYRIPPDWHRYQFSFIEGNYDKSLFPVTEWREVSRLVLGVKEVEDWSIGSLEADDEMLIDAVRSKLLSRRGIVAARDEILITVGEQQGLHLVTELFAVKGTKLVTENPGLPELRELFGLRGAQVSTRAVDHHGMVIGAGFKNCDLIHVSPSRQRPTGVTMPLVRRKELLIAAAQTQALIIEDDFECEMNLFHDPLPSIYSMDTSGRVIYLASISKVLAPGVRLGFLVGPRDVIAAARNLRNLTTRRPSPNNQRAAAYFLTLGHYDTMLRRLTDVYESRLMALRDALNHYRPLSIVIPDVSGGTSYWVKGPKNLDVDVLVKEAERDGILIEPAKSYFSEPENHNYMFRLGVTGIPANKIRDGIERLSKIITKMCRADPVSVTDDIGTVLTGEQITELLSGADLLYKTVYGEPCTISLRQDGQMIGKVGYASEERDSGNWWVEGDMWCRKWNQWAYGETSKFQIAHLDDRIFWLNAGGDRVDDAIIARR